MTTVAAPRRAPEPTVQQTIRIVEALIVGSHAGQPTVPAWCARCDQPARLPIGPGGELCTLCLAAEQADRQIERKR